MMIERDEQELVERAKQGDSRAFEKLVQAYERVIFNLALRMTNDREDARDIAQTVFVKAYQGLKGFDPKYRFFSWIYRIGVNESLNHRGRNRRHEELDEGLASDGYDADTRTEAVLVGGATRVPAVRAYVRGPVGARVLGIDAVLTLANDPATLVVDGLALDAGAGGVTLSGGGLVVTPDIEAGATADELHWVLGDCLPSSGSIAFDDGRVDGVMTFLATTPSTVATSVTCRRWARSRNTQSCPPIRSSRSSLICRCFRWPCCPAGFRPDTARRRTAPRSKPAIPFSSSASGVSEPARSRGHVSTGRHRSSPWIRSSSNRSRRWDSVRHTALRARRKPPIWSAT